MHPETRQNVNVGVVSGANVNFDRLSFIAERALLGERKEAFFSVVIPEKPGSFIKMIKHVQPRAVTEFSYRFKDTQQAQVYISLKVNNLKLEVRQILDAWRKEGMQGRDVSDNELAKSHARYMVGGKRPENERVFRFMFPEKPGALMRFLAELESSWNITLFHYRNHGDGKDLFYLLTCLG